MYRRASAKAKEFTLKELVAMLVTALSIGFIVNLLDWIRQGEVTVSYLLWTFLAVAGASFAVIMLRTVAQKWLALRLGYLTRYTAHKYGLPISIFLALFLKGIIPYVAPGHLRITESKRLRLGAFRYGLNYKHLASIGIAAPAACVLLMIPLKPIALATDSILITKILQATAAIAFFGLIPINGQEGFHILYYRRWLWVFVTIFVGVYFLLILLGGVFSYVVAAILAFAATWFYKRTYD
ncbi:MAG: hypothetical protein ACLFO2_00230 [Candidatus Woesearchaeota archaeon]